MAAAVLCASAPASIADASTGMLSALASAIDAASLVVVASGAVLTSASVDIVASGIDASGSDGASPVDETSAVGASRGALVPSAAFGFPPSRPGAPAASALASFSAVVASPVESPPHETRI